MSRLRFAGVARGRRRRSTGLDVAASVPATGITDPTGIANLEAWFDASQLGLADAAVVNSWTDLSGHSRHATPPGNKPSYRTGIVNGHGVVRFTASPATPVQTGAFMAAFTAGEGFIVARNFPAGSKGGGWWEGGQGGGGALHPFTDNNIYEGFGSTVRKTIGPSPSSLDVFNVWNVASAAGAWDARLNGASVFTTASNAVGFKDALVLGAGFLGSYISEPCDIGEVAVYSRVLSSAERAQMLAYLRAKWLTP